MTTSRPPLPVAGKPSRPQRRQFLGQTAAVGMAGVAGVLGLATVPVDESFFNLGGHSLLAVSLTSRLRQQGLHADIRVLFGQPSVAALAGRREVLVSRGQLVEIGPFEKVLARYQYDMSLWRASMEAASQEESASQQ